MLRCQTPEDGKAEGRLMLPQGDSTAQSLIQRVTEYGFPLSSVEESLAEGKFDHATATFHLLSQQLVRKLAARQSSLKSAMTSAGAGEPSRPLDEEVIEEDDEEDADEEISGHPHLQNK